MDASNNPGRRINSFAIFCLIPMAKKIGLVDKPGGQETSRRDPINCTIFLVLERLLFSPVTLIMIGMGLGFLILLLWINDDLWVHLFYKLAAQIIVAILMMFSTVISYK